MKKTEAVFLTDKLKNVVDVACERFEQWSIVNEASGQELVLEPDMPSAGWCTVTLWEPDDD